MSTKLTKISRLAVFIAAIACIGLGVGALATVVIENRKDPAIGPAPALLVEAIPVHTERGYEMARLFSGRVEAGRETDLGFEISGLVSRILVDEGDPVTAGQPVAELDTARLKARRDELLAAVNQAEAELALAEVTLKRREGVVDAGGASRQQVDEARQAYRSARAALDLARTRVASQDVDLGKATITAPFDGVVTVRSGDEGQVLNAGQPVLHLLERGAARIRVGVAGRLVDALHEGRLYTLNWRAQALTARLIAVLPVRADSARTVDVLFEPLNPPSTLRAGDLVNLSLTKMVAEAGFWLPISALSEGDRGLWSVYTVKPGAALMPAGIEASHQIERRPVAVIYQRDNQVFVRGPLGDQAQVVVSGSHRIVPNQWVRVAVKAPVQSDLGG